MRKAYPDRKFLHLMDFSEETDLVKDILKSPLGLASKLIARLFEERFEELKDDLDVIKHFTAGIGRAQSLSSTYKLASYYPFMFAFHQNFHSSFRARQGKVLEEIIRHILQKYGRCDEVPSNNVDRLEVLRNIFSQDKPLDLDIDVMGVDSANKKTIMIQLRSRDDTGGTTAKASLVDLLRELLRTDKVPMNDVLYLVCIWDPRQSMQKVSTIKKMYPNLRDLIEIGEEDFYDVAEKKLRLRDKIYLKMDYGTDEIARSIFEWIGDANHEVLNSISTIVDLVSNWDDLWISYAITSLELEVMVFSGQSNVKLLNEKYGQIGISFDYDSYHNLTDSIDKIVEAMIPLWTEDTIPLSSLSDKAQYIRDLLFLKAHYENVKEGSSKKKTTVLKEQLSFWPAGNVTDTKINVETDPELELVSFRELVPEINDTGYLTHAIFYYPAKFIPHVVRYALRSFTKEGDWVVDPFAGSGTVGVEAYLCRRNSFLLDLNPLLNHMIPLKIYDKKEKLSTDRLCQMLDLMGKSEHHFIPEWSNIRYWYRPEMLEVLSKYWGFIKNSERDTYVSIIESSLLKMSKHFSYAEHRTPKLFKSKSKLRYIDELAQEDWEARLNAMIGDHSLETLRDINDFAMSSSNGTKNPLPPMRVEFAGGVDSSYFSFQRKFDC